MRILFVLENAGSGSGRHVIDLSRGLIARGHDITLAYSRYRLEAWFEKGLAQTAALNTVTINMRPGLRLDDPPSLAALRRYIRKHGPFDVVHGHSSKGGALARLATSPGDAARVYTPHALYTLGYARGTLQRRIFGLLERTLARRCEGIICVSSAEYSHAREIGLPAGKLFTVENGIAPLAEIDRGAIRRRLGLRDNEVAIGFVGRLAAQKAVHRLIEAFVLVRNTHAHARLVIVGNGPDEAGLKILARDRGVSDSVIWTGEANGPEIMGALELFALPSRYEAFPYALLEAAARRLPIVTTNVGGVKELVHDGVNGVVVEQDDIDGFARGLVRLVGDHQQRRDMGAQSQRIGAHFNFDSMVGKTLAVYATLRQRH